MLETPTVDQIHAYLLARGWCMGDSGAAAYLMVTTGHSVRMLHEPTEYDRGKAVFDISLAEGRHPADVRQDILNVPDALPNTDSATQPSVGAPARATFLRQRRIDLGLSLREVASRAGFAVSVLHDYESGTYMPSARKLDAWADALGCDVTLTPRPAPPLRTRFDSLDELRQDMRNNAWARRVAAPAKPDDINEIKRRIAERESAEKGPK